VKQKGASQRFLRILRIVGSSSITRTFSASIVRPSGPILTSGEPAHITVNPIGEPADIIAAAESTDTGLRMLALTQESLKRQLGYYRNQRLPFLDLNLGYDINRKDNAVFGGELGSTSGPTVSLILSYDIFSRQSRYNARKANLDIKISKSNSSAAISCSFCISLTSSKEDTSLKKMLNEIQKIADYVREEKARDIENNEEIKKMIDTLLKDYSWVTYSFEGPPMSSEYALELIKVNLDKGKKESKDLKRRENNIKLNEKNTRYCKIL